MSAPPGSSVLIMGVCGSGKTETGRELAQRLGIRFIDADDFHSTESIAKMSSGVPLTDADREPWLRRLAVECGDVAGLACSALKAKYRQLLAAHQPRGISEPNERQDGGKVEHRKKNTCGESCIIIGMCIPSSSHLRLVRRELEWTGGEREAS